MKVLLFFIGYSFFQLFWIGGTAKTYPAPRRVGIPEDTLYWSSSHKLTIEDFGILDDEYDKYNLNSATTMGCYPITEHDTCYALVRSFFIKSGSAVPKDASAAILLHEQGHFDLCEIYARLFRKFLRETKTNKFKEVDFDRYWEYIGKAFKRYAKYLDKMDKFYEEETDYGENTLMQEVWSRRIERDLQSLDAYSNSLQN